MRGAPPAFQRSGKPAGGRLLAIAVRAVSGEPMRPLSQAIVSVEAGLAGDLRGRGRRQVTVLAREAWEAACAELGEALPWTVRRANLLVEGLDLAGSAGALLEIGTVVLEVLGETGPCRRLEIHPGLRVALGREWRGGVSCRVRTGGRLAAGDSVRLVPLSSGS